METCREPRERGDRNSHAFFFFFFPSLDFFFRWLFDKTFSETYIRLE